MNRDELLQECFGRSDFRQGDKMIEASEGGDVVAHADIYWRRVLVHLDTPQGEGATVASETFTVGAVGQVCVDPARRGEGWGRALMKGVYDEAVSHALVFWLALFGDVEFFGRFGYEHPAGAADPRFLICQIRDIPWPDGRIDTQGEW